LAVPVRSALLRSAIWRLLAATAWFTSGVPSRRSKQDAYRRRSSKRTARIRPVHPLLRNTVIGIVGLIIAGGLAALALLGRDTDLSILALLAAGIIGTLIGLFLYLQGWTWGSRAARRRAGGQAVLIALGGGVMAVVAAVALAGLAVLVLLFFLG
jgi:hypothetical protein